MIRKILNRIKSLNLKSKGPIIHVFTICSNSYRGCERENVYCVITESSTIRVFKPQRTMASEALNKLLNETSQNIKQAKDGIKYRNIDNDTLQLFHIIHKTTDNCPTLHMNYTLNKITTKEYKNKLTEHLKKKTLANKLKGIG